MNSTFRDNLAMPPPPDAESGACPAGSNYMPCIGVTGPSYICDPSQGYHQAESACNSNPMAHCPIAYEREHLVYGCDKLEDGDKDEGSSGSDQALAFFGNGGNGMKTKDTILFLTVVIALLLILYALVR